jgi:hypothetical protein
MKSGIIRDDEFQTHAGGNHVVTDVKLIKRSDGVKGAVICRRQ